MRKIVLCFVLLLLFLFSYKGANAASLSQITIALDRLKSSTTTGGLVCAQTPSSDNGTEARIGVTFPSDFSLNTTEANWTVTTSNIPSGATAWPGIGTATSISGSTATFPSSNLSTSTYYCFRFSETNTLTTGAIGEKTGSFTTQTSGASTIDSGSFGLTIINNDQISVSAEVEASPDDLEAELLATTPGSVFSQNKTINYQLTYGSTLPYSTSLTVEAVWSLGTIDGNSTPSEDILDYVIGSASQGYNSTAPVVDLENRKITWTIASFPANTSGQTVTFSLRTNDSYTDTDDVSFAVTGRVTTPTASSADSTVTKMYRYIMGPTPTSQPATSVPATTTPTPPGTASQRPVFSSIRIREITHDKAVVDITLLQPATLDIQYGLSPLALTSRIRSVQSKTFHTIELSPLKANTIYYFRVTARAVSGLTTTSDIFTFITAKDSDIAEIDLSNLIFTSYTIILLSPQAGLGEKELLSLVLPLNTPFEFRMGIKDKKSLKRAQAQLKNKKVLGLSSMYADSNSTSVEMVEVKKGVYDGRLKTPKVKGVYQLVVRLSDINGTIHETNLLDIYVKDPFTIQDDSTLEPLEGVSVLLYQYNIRTRMYDIISPVQIPFTNPLSTNNDGQLDIALPEGKYKADIHFLGYKDQTIEFTVAPNEKDNYPTILLEKEAFSLATLFKQQNEIFTTFLSKTSFFLQDLTDSEPTHQLNAVIILIMLVAAAVLSLRARTHISYTKLFTFVHFGTHKLFTNQQEYISGRVIDERTKKGLSGVEVLLLDEDKDNLIVDQVMTNKNGIFFFRQYVKHPLLMAIKKGYKSLDFDTKKEDHGKGIVLTLQQESEKSLHFFLHLRTIFSNLVAYLFEILLLLSFLLELFFTTSLGLAVTLPFLILSTSTLFLWILYLHTSKR